MKTTKHTDEEILNDESLRWHPYKQWELVWSDVHGKEMRFYGYEDDFVRLATFGMAKIDDPDGLVRRDQVRRPTVMPEYGTPRNW